LATPISSLYLKLLILMFVVATLLGKAKYASKAEAVKPLKNQKKRPIFLSKVSGKYMETCRTLPGKCVYWNLEKTGVKCIERTKFADLCKSE